MKTIKKTQSDHTNTKSHIVINHRIYFSFRRIDKTHSKNTKVSIAYHLEKQDYSPKNNTKKGDCDPVAT